MVCTGNIARSPIGEALFARKFQQVHCDAHVHSAGFLTEDRPADDEGIEVMHTVGIDLSTHRSRLITPEMIAEADLIVTMERAHVREIAVMDDNAFWKTFTLPELGRLVTEKGPRHERESVAAYLTRLGISRRPTDLLGRAPQDEIEDPHGGPRKAFRSAAVEIDRLSTLIVNQFVPPCHRPSPAPSPEET